MDDTALSKITVLIDIGNEFNFPDLADIQKRILGNSLDLLSDWLRLLGPSHLNRDLLVCFRGYLENAPVRHEALREVTGPAAKTIRVIGKAECRVPPSVGTSDREKMVESICD